MKKLMIAAAIAALAGVTFADCGIDCAYAYRLKLAGKTVKGKSLAAKSACETGACWAKPASLRIAGYIYGVTDAEGEEGCATCGCNDFSGFETVGFWNENKVQVTFEPTVELFEILRNGGAKNKAQILIKAGDLNLAGFGVYNPKTQKLKSASGFFAGTIEAPVCAGAYDKSTCEWGEATPAQVYTLCNLEEAADASAAIAYGRWSLTYKADKVAALEAGAAAEAVLLPAGYVAAE